VIEAEEVEDADGHRGTVRAVEGRVERAEAA